MPFGRKPLFTATRALNSKPSKSRLDRLLVQRGLVGSRERAQSLILAGRVLVDQQKAEKAGVSVSGDSRLEIIGEPVQYVSRAGLKLAGALDAFGLSPRGKVSIDIGASTGGFTQCLLEHGATKVYAVDAGTNQLDWSLRQDARVVVMEKTNARYLRFDRIGERAALLTMDVSFISSTLILPAMPQFLAPGADVLILVKPQFEVGRKQVGKGGIVRAPHLHAAAVRKVWDEMHRVGFDVQDSMESPLPGAEGNREFFLHAVWPAAPRGC
ncbi:MAG: TlyA family RNA methyltransferase [Terriglobia bacterium]